MPQVSIPLSMFGGDKEREEEEEDDEYDYGSEIDLGDLDALTSQLRQEGAATVPDNRLP